MADIIRSPGKFEGQPTWVPLLWDLSLEGWSDEDFGRVQFFRLDDTVRAKVQTLPPDAFGVRLEETDQGFVGAEVYDTEAEYMHAVDAAGDDDTYDGDNDTDTEGIEL
jgi:hypothetical protein